MFARKVNDNGICPPWIITVFVFIVQFSTSSAICSHSEICIQTRTPERPPHVVYTGSKFPDIRTLFNVSLDDIETLEIRGTNIESLSSRDIGQLTNLSKLYIDGCKKLEVMYYAFKKNKALSIIHIKNCGIERFKALAFDGAFQKKSFIGELNLKGNRLIHFPSFTSRVPGLKKLYLDKNGITRLTDRSLRNLDELELLSLRETSLRSIGDDVFAKTQHLVEFTAFGSRELSEITKNAFREARNLKILDLGNTAVTFLPSLGLEHLVQLNLKGVTTIVAFSDDFVSLPQLRKVYLAQERRYLCCAFKYKRKESLHTARSQNVSFTRDCSTESITTTAQVSSPYQTVTTPYTTNRSQQTTTDGWGGWGRRKRALLSFGDWLPSPNRTSTDPTQSSPPHFTDDNFGHHTVKHRTAIFICGNNSNASFVEMKLEPVDCYPEPDALRPCDDIMGNVYLTSISWIVSFLAVITNGIVFGVLVMSRRQFTVTKFLIINLAFADLCLGLYLFVLTCASIDTTGKYYNSVYTWQYDGGCDVAGFLAIFSSELSMLILTIITIERYLAIVYAVYLQKRLRLRHARYLAAGAWAVAVILALLPIVGVNSYQDVAICLPFRNSNSGDIAYLAFVFGCNALLFLVIIFCYIRIYLEVAGPYSDARPASQTNDSSIAQRIALLVFTDFACWLPIAVIGIIAAAGYSDSINMTVEKSKYLLVIFFPINSICNPFLYALSTRTFQREFFTVLAQCGYCRERLHKYNTNTYTSKTKPQNKGWRSTGTFSLSTMDSAHNKNTLKSGTKPVSGAVTSQKGNSPVHDTLFDNQNPVVSTQSDEARVHNVTPVHLVCDQKPEKSSDHVVVPPLERATSRTPLCEESGSVPYDRQASVVEEEIAL